MGTTKLYKYLDADGGLKMLYYSTLMFTNATQLNDPFDCHPALVDIPQDAIACYRGWPSNVVSEIEYRKGLNRRDKAYVCSLSKTPDSILMWSYYSKHTGVCIGLDVEQTRKYTSKMHGLFLGCAELEVQYRDKVSEPADGNTDLLTYHFATKARDWQHEQEVRLLAYDPSPVHMRLLPDKNEDDDFCHRLKRFFQARKKETPLIDWKTVRAFLDIGGECFESVRLGVNMTDQDKEKIIKVARKCNPDIKIYQMTIDPEAFRLKEEEIR